MKVKKEPLYFIGHQGLMSSLNQDNHNTMYILDANLVLTLIQAQTSGNTLSQKHQHFLSMTKEAVQCLWHQNSQWIPVNPVLALMELKKQDTAPNYKSYLKMYNEFNKNIYGIKNLAPEWILATYISIFKALVSTHPSIAKTIEAIYALCPTEEKVSDEVALRNCNRFLNWVWQERASLTLIGGPLLYLAVYAICGSPQARAFIKYSKRSPLNAKNVAWDLCYWVLSEMYYHQGKYDNAVVCTSDHALAELLSSRINQGPRGQLSTPDQERMIDSYGEFYPLKLKKLENTKLEQAIFEKVSQLLIALDVFEKDRVKFGFKSHV
jgi:hypothetical protein